MDKLRAFEVFVNVAERGSFIRAAEALNTSPANVTRYVGELEAYLGTRLLQRSSRRVSLTEDGTALLQRSRAVLADVSEMEALVASDDRAPQGMLRINAPVSFAVQHLAPLWPQFLARYPEVRLDIVLIDRVVDLVEEGFDLAIRISEAGSASHVARKLTHSRNILAASPDYVARHGMPVQPDDLARHKCLGYSLARSGDEWQIIDPAGKPRPTRVSCDFHANNGDTLRLAALAGEGITWQPTFLIGDDLRAGRLVEVMPGYRMPDIDIQAVFPSRRHLSLKVRAMIDFLVDAFSGTPSWDRG